MSLQVQTNYEDTMLQEVEKTNKLCGALMKTPHYQKMGPEGIFAIVQKAKSIGMDPLDALNGGMYMVQGKVEMSGQAMLSLIRSKGHSVSIDSKSTNEHVIIHGKRCDNGDTWRVEFGVKDAQLAGIYRNMWTKYPKTMCIWRCVSMLGRFLFSDVIKGVYVAGEISNKEDCFSQLDQNIDIEVVETKPEPEKEMKCNKLEAEELQNLLLMCNQEFQEKVFRFKSTSKFESWEDMPYKTYLTVFEKIKSHIASEKEKALKEMETVEAVNE